MKANIFLLGTLSVLLAVSCIKEDVRLVYEPQSQQEDDGQKAEVSFSTMSPFTRSILDDEDKDSGFQLFVYRKSTGLLEGVFRFESRSGDTIKLTAGEVYDFYAIGNMWFIDAEGGCRSYSDYFDVAGWNADSSPLRSADLSNTARMPVYRFDGLSPVSGLRTETFSEIAQYGIPYSGSALSVTATDGASVTIPCTRLFSKVSVTVDHGGLVNSGVGESAFINKTLHLRQASCKVHPFVTGIKAESASDIISQSDYESSMANGSSLTFVLYVPENAQNVTLSTEDALRIPDNVPSSQRDLLTYVEFTGAVDGSAGGYGGNLLYRFYIGREDAGTFKASIERGLNYNVTLSFKAGSLFDPYWKVECTDAGGLSDSRCLCFAKDAAGTSLLPDGQMLAIRKNREGKAWIYFNRSGVSESNELSGYLDSWSSGYNPSNVSRSAYSITYDSTRASALGVSVTVSDGCLMVSRYDDTLFDANLGETLPVTLTLYPGGGSTVINARLCENLGVSADFSEYYVGMKRSLTATGFCGGNVSLKLKSGDTGLVRYVNTEGTDGYITSSGTQFTGSTVPLYAYKNGSAVITVSSDDDFNDGEFDFELTVKKPIPYYGDIPVKVPVYNPFTGAIIKKTACKLPMDGTAVEMPAYYKDGAGNRISIGDAAGDFDNSVYAQLLDFVYNTKIPWIGREENTYKVYVKQIYNSSGYLFGIYSCTPPVGTWLSVTNMSSAVKIHPVNTEIFCEDSDALAVEVCVATPYFREKFPDVTSDYFNTWDPSWNWTRLSELDAETIIAKWPVVQTSAEFRLNGCSEGNFSMANAGEGSEYVKNDRIRTEDGKTYVDWRFAPGENSTDCYDYRGALAPYGSQRLDITMTNIRSLETFTITGTNFNVSYNKVNLRSYAYFFTGAEEAEAVWGSPLALAWLLLERSNNPYFDVPSDGIPAPLDAFSNSMISFEGIDNFAAGAESGTPPYFEFSSNTGSKYTMKAPHRAFWVDNKTTWLYPASSYSSTTWNYAAASATYQYCQVWPNDFCFKNGATTATELPSSWYSDTALYSVVKFGFDYDAYIPEYGVNNLVRQGFMVLDE